MEVWKDERGKGLLSKLAKFHEIPIFFHCSWATNGYIWRFSHDYNDYTMVQAQEVMANVTNVTAQMVGSDDTLW